MNLLGILGLIWSCLKLVIDNDTVNTALDHWTEGTSNKIDDAIWGLLEAAAGMTDHVAKAAMLEDGLRAIEDQYQVAKLEGTLEDLKRPTRCWAVPANAVEIRELLTGIPAVSVSE